MAQLIVLEGRDEGPERYPRRIAGPDLGMQRAQGVGDTEDTQPTWRTYSWGAPAE